MSTRTTPLPRGIGSPSPSTNHQASGPNRPQLTKRLPTHDLISEAGRQAGLLSYMDNLETEAWRDPVRTQAPSSPCPGCAEGGSFPPCPYPNPVTTSQTHAQLPEIPNHPDVITPPVLPRSSQEVPRPLGSWGQACPWPGHSWHQKRAGCRAKVSADLAPGEGKGGLSRRGDSSGRPGDRQQLLHPL